MNWKQHQRAIYINEILKGGENLHILEIGVGDGVFAKYLLDNYKNISYYAGFDISRLLSKKVTLSNYIVSDSIEKARLSLTKGRMIDFVIVAYSFHHFPGNEKIDQLLNFLSQRNIKILVIEEILTTGKYNKRVNILNDIISNIFQYGPRISTIKEYFSLRFKTDAEWKNIFSKYYVVRDLKSNWRYGYMYTKGYLLERR